MSLDERWIRSLHVEAMRHADLHAERDPHVLFQASTIGALLEGSFEGDVTFAELAQHGDLGLGTLNHLDGEMIAIDGRFYRADLEGNLTEVPSGERTPFAVVVGFRPEIEFDLEGSLDHDRLLAEIDRRIPADAASCAVRIDGRFESVGPDPCRARSRPTGRSPRSSRTSTSSSSPTSTARCSVSAFRIRRGNRGRRLAPARDQRGPQAWRPRSRLPRGGRARPARSLERAARGAAA